MPRNTPILYACRCRFGLPVPLEHDSRYGACSWLESEPGGYLRDWHTVPVVEPRELAHGDYCGGSVERANYQVWCEDYAETEGILWIRQSYAYGGRAVAVRAGVVSCTAPRLNPNAPATAIIEALRALERYPSLDDDHLSRMETEESRDAWRRWVARDFAKAVADNLGVDCDLSYTVGEDVAQQLWDLYQTHGGESESPYCESGPNYVFPRLEQAVKKVTVDEYIQAVSWE